MSTVPSVFATNNAIQRADENANINWKTMALAVIRDVARTKPFLTADDIREVLDTKDVCTHDTSALGGVIRQAVKAGYITGTGEYKKSERPATHRRPLPLWQSLVWKGGAV